MPLLQEVHYVIESGPKQGVECNAIPAPGFGPNGGLNLTCFVGMDAGFVDANNDPVAIVERADVPEDQRAQQLGSWNQI